MGGLVATIRLPSSRDVAGGLVALRMLAQAQLVRARRAGRPLPGIYESGVRYKGENGERWQLPQETLDKGFGDCEDLAAWLSAQENLAGRKCEAVVKQVGRRMKHAVVRYADGRIEDPSRKLGMGRNRRS